MTNEEQKKDDIETMRILFNADINELCNQRRFNNAKEMEGIRDRLIQALEAQPTDVLDKIKAEIEKTYINITYQENKDRQASWGLRKALQIIDKYKAESEVTE